MQKSVIYTEKEFKELPEIIIRKFIEESKKPWGYKLLSNETKKIAKNENEIFGYLYPFISRALEDL